MSATKIIFLILPHVHLLDLAGPDQVFLEAKDHGVDIEVEYCSVETPILTSSHLGISRLQMFKKVKANKGDYIFIPGAEVDFLVSENFPQEKEISKWLHEAYAKGAYLCSVCTGAFLLARLGLLNAKKCTTHWKRTAELKARYPLVNLMQDILFTEDEGLFTSAGVTAGIDMALYVVERLKDSNVSFRVARELVVYMRRQGGEMQQTVFLNYRNHIHSSIHEVQDFIQENIQKRLSLTAFAHLACMSERNLTRVFKKETGITINEYVSLVRKEYLKKLIENPDLTRKKIAALCGLKSERQVIRLLKEIG